jgi:putative transposase
MKQKRFREEQIVRILREAETGQMPIVEVCRKHAISEFTFYRWRWKYQGLSISEARRLKELEKENTRLKQLLANRDLEIDAIREVLRKNS